MPKQPTILEKRDMVAHLAGHLVRLGFRVAHRSRNGSRYLSYPGLGPFLMRISDHKVPLAVAQQFPTVVKSVAVRPAPARDVPALALELAIGFLIRRDLRLGILRGGPQCLATGTSG